VDEHDLNEELQEAWDDPDNFDFGFEDERLEDNFANFDFDPEEAERLQQEEMDRIRAEEGFDEDDDDLEYA
jgi:hypothetical protein